MAGIPAEEPRPRGTPLPWQAFRPRVLETEPLARPEAPRPRDFGDVLRSRRSGLAGPVGWTEVAGLLWHAAGIQDRAPSGRAGIPVERRASPSAGGLHPIHLVCINGDGDGRVRLYDAHDHAFHVLDVDHEDVSAKNAAVVGEILGASRGCTLRLVADVGKVEAAYENPESLVLRDAGCVVAVLCLCAEWLGLTACPLGFLGDELLAALDFPGPRFRALGAVQITAPVDPSGP